MTSPAVGHQGWHDLTVDDAETLRDFYMAVAGWTAEPLDMGGYADFVMKAPDGTAVAGVCHARGGNADIPPQWLMYVVVPDVDAAIEAATERGGAVIVGPKGKVPNRYAIVRDPAGAVFALHSVR